MPEFPIPDSTLDRALRRNGLERLIGTPINRWRFEPSENRPPAFYAKMDDLIALDIQLAMQGDTVAKRRVLARITFLAKQVIDVTPADSAAA